MTTSNFNEMVTSVRTAIIDILKGTTVVSDQYGEGEITEIVSFNLTGVRKPSVFVNINYSDRTVKCTMINVAGAAFKNGPKLTAETQKQLGVYNDTLLELNRIQAEYNKELSEASMKRMQENIMKKKEALLQKNAKSKQEKIIENLTNLYAHSKQSSKFDDELEWITKHVSTISACIPDYLEGWFVKTFGEDAPKKVVDSRRKTSGGYSMKWNPSFSISFTDIDDEIPVSLKNKLVKNKINDTAMVFDLVENYGFKFGKN